MAQDLRERSLGELLGELSSETATLVKQEIDLAKAELAKKGKDAGAGAAMFGVASVLGLAAVGALTAFLIMLLASFMPDPLAAFIVTAGLGGVAYYFVTQGQKKLKDAAPPVPEQTVETIKEDIEWAKNPTRSDVR
jgi:uncharacterized small protein (DUF1192 family)